jgi:hypothetical protein
LAFRAYYVVYVIAGLLLFSYLVPGFPLDRFKEALLFVALIVVADMAQISLPRGGASIYASSPIDLAGIVLLGAPAMVVIEAASSLLSELVIQRRPLVKIVFNVPLLVVTVGAAGLAYYAFPEEWRSFESGRFLLPLGVCAVVYYLVNTISISVVIALQSARNPVHIWKANYMWTFSDHRAGVHQLGSVDDPALHRPHLPGPIQLQAVRGDERGAHQHGGGAHLRHRRQRSVYPRPFVSCFPVCPAGGGCDGPGRA